MPIQNLSMKKFAPFGQVFVRFCSTALLIFGNTNLVGQNLTLFEATESNNISEDVRRARDLQRDSNGNIITGPEFTLIGTTRIGGAFLAVVEDRAGEIISVRFSEGVETRVPGYPGFQVLDIGSGNVVIKYPGNVTCTEYRNQGVSCDAPDVVRLELKNADPLENSHSGMTANSAGASSTDEETTPNPFEALLERASNSGGGADSSFTPRRINPEDVPPGMRIVSTPFGDRLVDEE